MSFMQRQRWHCQFLEEDLKTALPRKLRFATPDKFVELAERTGALRDLACRQAVQHGISEGRGGVWLVLTGEQYDRLKCH
jgi:hypothetical protein